MKYLAMLLFLPLLAGCADTGPSLATDIAEADVSDDCPVGINADDRAMYPACN